MLLLLHAYLVWGANCVARSLGDYCVAIWTNRVGAVLCAGSLRAKPFYYAESAKFSSRFQHHAWNCVRQYPGVSVTLNDLASRTLLFGSNQDRGHDRLADIRRRTASALPFVGRRCGARPAFWTSPFVGARSSP
jgi:asparagine synthetase B (glutamine-hydrolysing)